MDNTNAIKHQGIIIIGAPRSGTTLLRRLINSHPNIACPGETFLMRGGARFLSSETIVDGIDYGVRGGLNMSGFEEAEIYLRLREFITSFHQDYAKERNKTRWAEKTAVDSFYLNEIEKFTGDHAYFICLVRNGVDIVNSWSGWTEANQKYIKEVHDYIKRFPSPYEAYAHAWCDITQSILDFSERHQANAILVRYEDLVENPNDELTAILNFIGEDMPPDLIKQSLRSTDDIGMGDWKTYERIDIGQSSVGSYSKFPEGVASVLGKIMNEHLLMCGYESLPISDTLSEEQAERKYQMAMMFQAMQARNKQPNNK